MAKAGSGLENTVFVSVTFSMPYWQRKGNIREIETSADISRLALSKKILRCPEYDRCRKISVDVRRKIRDEYGFPTVVLREGVYRIPVSLKEEVREYIEGEAAKFYSLVDSILGKYDFLIEQDRNLLGDQFDPRDYLPPEDLRKRFRVRYKFFQIASLGGSVPSEEEVKEELENIRTILRQSALNLLEAIARAFDLSGDRKHPLRRSLWKKMEFFLKVFGAKNLTGDEDLAKVIREMEEEIGTVSYEEASSESFRVATKAKVDELVRKVTNLVGDADRAILLD